MTPSTNKRGTEFAELYSTPRVRTFDAVARRERKCHYSAVSSKPLGALLEFALWYGQIKIVPLSLPSKLSL